MRKTPRELLERLRRLDVRLSPRADGGLEYDAPEGVVTPELLGDVKDRKAALIELLQAETAQEPRASTERVLYRSGAGVEVVEVQPIDPASAARYEKRWRPSGTVVSLLGEATGDRALADAWVCGLRASDAQTERTRQRRPRTPGAVA